MARLKSSVEPTDSTPSSQPSTRSWGQRLLITGVIFGALAAFGSAGAIWFVQQQLEDRNLVAIDDGSQSVTESADFGEFDLASDDGGEPAQEATATESDEPPAPVETFPPAEPSARNILITGADNNSCISPIRPTTPRSATATASGSAATRS